MEAHNPATGERVGTYESDDDAAAEAALDAAVEAFSSWQDRPITEREELLASAADVLRNNERRYAETMTEEMGKPIDEAVAEVEKCAWACDHYAEYAGAYLAAEAHPSPPGRRSGRSTTRSGRCWP